MPLLLDQHRNNFIYKRHMQYMTQFRILDGGGSTDPLDSALRSLCRVIYCPLLSTRAPAALNTCPGTRSRRLVTCFWFTSQSWRCTSALSERRRGRFRRCRRGKRRNPISTGYSDFSRCLQVAMW